MTSQKTLPVCERHRRLLGLVMGNPSYSLVPQSLSAVLFLVCVIAGPALGTDLSFVTCGSVVKLLNLKHNVRLHSHDVRYGSGECT